jgi:nucleoside-diphosphate-sugar epimerase
VRVLLTGATGYVGSRVLECLVERGDFVRVLALPETVEQVRHRDRVQIVAGSLADDAALDEATGDVEIIYHLAAVHLRALRSGSSCKDLKAVNVLGTESLLRAAVASRVRRFVFTSSVAVYNRAPWPFLWPIHETFALRSVGDDNLRNYAQSKIDAEDAVRRFHHEHGIEAVILRSAAVYGPGARWAEEIVRGVLANPLRAFSPVGRFESNQWVHRDDLADAVVLAGTDPAMRNEIFNVAGGELFSLRDILAAASRSLGRPMPIAEPAHPRATGTYALRYDLTRVQTRLGYTPRVKLAQGLDGVLAAMDPPARLASPFAGAAAGPASAQRASRGAD